MGRAWGMWGGMSRSVPKDALRLSRHPSVRCSAQTAPISVDATGKLELILLGKRGESPQEELLCTLAECRKTFLESAFLRVRTTGVAPATCYLVLAEYSEHLRT